jgi:predicted nucleic acid-binding protein
VIFVDTSFWVALQNVRDNHHAQAVSLGRRYQGETLVTTNHVRGETWTFLRRRAGHAEAVRFLDATARSPRVRIVRVDADHEREAEEWLRRHDEREYSFVDATSFSVMRRRRLRRVCIRRRFLRAGPKTRQCYTFLSLTRTPNSTTSFCRFRIDALGSDLPRCIDRSSPPVPPETMLPVSGGQLCSARSQGLARRVDEWHLAPESTENKIPVHPAIRSAINDHVNTLRDRAVEDGPPWKPNA